MGEETDQIEQHIAEEREKLGRTFDEIEKRIQDATDLKAHFDRNIGWVLGAAAAGGFLLSLGRVAERVRAGHSPPWQRRGGCALTNCCEASLAAQTGWFVQSTDYSVVLAIFTTEIDVSRKTSKTELTNHDTPGQTR